MADASEEGWGAVLICDGRVRIVGDFGAITTHFIMKAEARAVRYALLTFQDHLSGQLDIVVHKTSLMRAARKMRTKSFALAYELRSVADFLHLRPLTETFRHVRYAENLAQGLSQGRSFTGVD